MAAAKVLSGVLAVGDASFVWCRKSSRRTDNAQVAVNLESKGRPLCPNNQPPGSLIKQLAPVLFEREHAGRQIGADTSLPLVRHSSGGENGDQSTNVPLIHDLKQPASVPEI